MGKRTRRGPVAVRTGVYALFLLGGLCIGHGGFAQDKADPDPKQALPRTGQDTKAEPKPPRVGDPLPFDIESARGHEVSASLQMLSVANPIVVCATRLAVASSPSYVLMGPDWKVELEAPLPLSSKLLGAILDDTAFPKPDRPPHLWTAEEKAFRQLFSDALIDTTLVPADFFDKAAEENDYVTYSQMFNDPHLYRGWVVPMQGHMKRLLKQPAPRLAEDRGLGHYYEAWIFGPKAKVSPVCLVFTSLPDGVQTGDFINQRVKFSAYFVKKFRYEADSKEVRRTLLFVGKTITVIPDPPPIEKKSIFTRDVLLTTAGGAVAITVVIVGLSFWFRRSDRSVQKRIASLREKPLDLGPDGMEAESPAEKAPEL